jgi:competence ComEA-like helix-hairpin-helix protein
MRTVSHIGLRSPYVFFCLLAFWTVSCSRETVHYQSSKNENLISQKLVNINTASETELRQLPHIGDVLAKRIVEFRQTNGPFRRPEHLLLVDGISDSRYNEIKALITTR